MRICIYGVGGVGGYFGGKIAHFLNIHPELQHEIYFIARGNHLKEIQEKGLQLNLEQLESIICKPTIATDDISKLPQIDLFLICVKSYDLNKVIQNIKPFVHDSTIIIPLLNGIDIYERIRKILKNGMILPACVYVGTHIEQYGIVTQKGGEGKIILGFDPQNQNYNPEKLISLFIQFGIQIDWQNDPNIAIWSKFIFISSYGLVCAATSKSLGEVFNDLLLKDDVSKIMQEIYSIALIKKIILPNDIIEKSISKALNFPFDARTSFQRDIENSIPTPKTSQYFERIKQIQKK